MSKPELFCSTIIPTLARDTLASAVESVLGQNSKQPVEVIVVNDSGRPLPPANWQHAAGVKVVDTVRRERSVARNVGAVVARGRYLHFLDDDDWLLPGALDVFAALADSHPAGWLYGATQLTDSTSRCQFQFDHQLSGNCLVQAMAGEWVPLQASLVAASVFFAVGGFDPAFSGAEDKDLLMRVALSYDIAGTATPVAGILRGTWSSSTSDSVSTRNWHMAREQMLDQPGVLARLHASANNAYWRGRLLRIYLLSAWWNILWGRPITSVGRLIHATGAGVRAGPRLLSPEFWRALTRPHLTAGFAPAAARVRPSPYPVQSNPAD